MKKIVIINGPNLNLVGKREPDIYGSLSMDEFIADLKELYAGDVHINYFQSNIEGELVSKIQEEGYKAGGIILNAGGYTHTSVALRDAVAAVPCPVIEVHLSNPMSREEFRHQSLLTGVCKGIIAGFGLESYVLAVDSFMT